MSRNKNSLCVLVMGYRQGLCEALEGREIPYVIWSEKPVKATRKALFIQIEKFRRDNQRIDEILSELDEYKPFTHVIAGTEAAVYPAAVARRILQARLSTKSVALRCHDKLHMKSFLLEHEIPMTDFVAGDDIQDAGKVLQRLGVPVVIKVRHESGGRGIELVETPNDLIRHAGRHKIMERFVSAPEASVESYINHGKVLFENITQYYVKKHINLVPGWLMPEIQTELLALNRKVVNALKVKWGITHMEVYLSDEGILFGEIALRPPGGYIMELISKAYGFSSWDALVCMELDLDFNFPESSKTFSAGYILHPGEGEVKKINGWQELSTRKSVFKSSLKVEPGSRMGQRQGVGEDAGYLLMQSDSKEALQSELQSVDQTLSFEMA